MGVRFLQSSSGRKYVMEDILNLPNDDKLKLLESLEDLERFPFETLIASGRVKPLHGLKSALHELVVSSVNAGYRIFLVRRDDVLWLLHLIKKKSNETPSRDVGTALNRAKLID